VAIDPGGRLAVVGHGDGSVAVVTLADGASRVLFAVAVPPASPLAVAFGDADASVVAADATGLLTAWSGRLASGDGSITRLGRHAGGVGALRHLGQASVLAAGRQDGVLSTWPLPGREPARPAMEGEKA
jgi:hypothetical protein